MTGRSVLVVEDDDLAAMTTARVLTRGGHRVDRCASLAEATAAIDAARPDVVVLDRRLADGDGVAFAGELRRRLGADTPRLVLLSGDPLTSMEQQQVDVFLHKPADLRSLLDAVE